MVRELLAAGVKQERVAKAIGISVDTLARRYPEEVAEGQAAFDVAFERCMMQVALDPDPKNNVLRIFLSKVRLGYREAASKTVEESQGEEAMSADRLREEIAQDARRRRAESARVDDARRTRVAKAH